MAIEQLEDLLADNNYKTEFLESGLDDYFSKVLNGTGIEINPSHVSLSINDEDGKRYIQFIFASGSDMHIFKVTQNKKESIHKVIRNYQNENSEAIFDLDTSNIHQLKIGSETLTFEGAKSPGLFVIEVLK